MSAHRFSFRTQWLGYDRAEVNRFLNQVAADRQFLKDKVNYLESVVAKQTESDQSWALPGDESDEPPAVDANAQQRQLERLKDLTREMAACLATSTSVLQKVQDLLAVEAGSPVAEPATDVSAVTSSDEPDTPESSPTSQTSRRLAYAGLAVLAVGGGVVTAVSRTPAPHHHGSAMVVAQMAPVTRLEASRPEPVTMADQILENTRARVAEDNPPVAGEGLALMITAKAACWIRSVVDGSHPVERLMQPGQTILVWAHDEVLLRAGDGAALTLTINGQTSAPLGRAGQVVTHRITRENLKLFLQDQI
jgi:DivIVA domain-containing protein